jgi:uncharacterized membrane protein
VLDTVLRSSLRHKQRRRDLLRVSLVPPLAVVGLTLESDAPDQALGALLLLFVTNVTAILATGLVVMAVYRINRLAKISTGTGRPALHRGRAITAIAVGLIVIAIPLAFTSIRITKTATTESSVSKAAEAWAAGVGWEVASVNTVRDLVRVRVTGPEPAPDVGGLEQELSKEGVENTTVKVELIPSTSVEIDSSD